MRALLLALAACVPLLAGCSGPAGDAGEDSEGPAVITDPRDTSYLQDGTLAAGSHVHDYWGGRDRVTVVSESWEGSQWSCSGCEGTMGFAQVRPAEGAIVPQGTRWVNGTFTIGDHPQNTFTGLELWVKTAQDQDLRRWGPIQSGVPFSIASTQEANDPPHYVLSLWRFEVVALGGDEITAGGPMAWSVHAVRGLPLVPYPPHPDRWGDATELPVLAEGGATELTYEVRTPTSGQTSCSGGCPAVHVPPSGVVIPHDTGRLEAVLRIDGGLPAGLGLLYHGADTWTMAWAEGESESPGTVRYTIPIEGSMADSPYAPQSLWEFRVWMQQPQPHVQAWTGSYTLEVTAHKR